VRAVAADQGSEVLDGEPGDGQAGLDRGLPEGLGEVRLSRPRGPADAEILPAADPFQTLQGVLGGPGYGRFSFVPVAEGLAGGEPGPLAAGVQVGAVAAGGFLSEKD